MASPQVQTVVRTEPKFNFVAATSSWMTLLYRQQQIGHVYVVDTFAMAQIQSSLISKPARCRPCPYHDGWQGRHTAWR